MWYYFLDNPHPVGCLPSQQPALTAALLLPWGRPGKEGAGKGKGWGRPHSCRGRPGNAEIPGSFPAPTADEVLGTPLCYRQSSGFFYPLQTSTLILPEWFYLPRNVLSTIPMQNTAPAIALVHIPTGRDRFVWTEQETAPQEHPSASRCRAVCWQGTYGPKISPGSARPGGGESSYLWSEMTDTDGLWSDRIRGRFTFHIVFCIKKYISEICYRQGQDYRVHNVNRLLSDFIFVKLLLLLLKK